MKKVEYTICYGGFVGAEESYYVDVEDDATDEEIEEEIEKDFEEKIRDNCYWESRR